MDDFLPGLFVGILAGFFIGSTCGIIRTENRMREKAVEARAAEYYLDLANIRQFRYISSVKVNEKINLLD